MKIEKQRSQKGFSLVEMIVGIFVMSVVITGGLIGLTQANLLSEKASEQAMADFLLRVEAERMRSMDWSEVTTLADTIIAYEKKHNGDRYNTLQSMSDDDLSDANMTAEIKTADLNSGGIVGKQIFHVTLNWEDKTGKDHSESRVLVITEGGFSADS
ncbi:MAG: type IV pilus modification PilV family protein [Opitutaceae bacterium]